MTDESLKIECQSAEQVDIKVRVAARALGNAGLVHAYGHCSMRLDSERFLVCAPQPMGTIKANEPGTVVAMNKPLPEGVLGEVRIHQQAYLKNPNVNAVCRVMPQAVMTLSALGLTPVPRHGLGAYFGAEIPLWEDPRLLRDDHAAVQLVDFMGRSPAVIMRGNGAVVVGAGLEQAISYCWFLEDAARLEIAARNLLTNAEEGRLSAQEIVDRQVFSGGVFERMWRFMTYGDEEISLLET